MEYHMKIEKLRVETERVINNGIKNERQEQTKREIGKEEKFKEFE